MQKPFRISSRSVVDILLIILLFCFILQSVVGLFSYNFSVLVHHYLYFSPTALSEFLIWTPITYSLFHDGPFHLILNMLGFYFIGKNVEVMMGKLNFCYLLLIGSILGSLFWLVFNTGGDYLVGSSAVVMASLSFYCLRQPDNLITLLLFFILPCKLKPRWILIGVLTIEIYGFLFSEINASSGIAHSAHLGGLLGGAIVFLFLRSGRDFPRFVLNISPSNKINKSLNSAYKVSKLNVCKNTYKVNFTNTAELQKEVDRILDKINEFGFGALSQDEKLTLDKAKGLLRS
jgi:membrane associated rhomboid family serine protease